MPSAILIVTALFPCSALLLLFWAIGDQLIRLAKGRKAMVRIPAEQNKGCMVSRKQSSNREGMFW